MCPLGSLKAQSKLKRINFVRADHPLCFSMMAFPSPPGAPLMRNSGRKLGVLGALSRYLKNKLLLWVKFGQDLHNTCATLCTPFNRMPL